MLMIDALSKYDLTQAQCQEAFKRGQPSAARKALRERVRAMLVDLRAADVAILSMANFLGVDRRRVNDLAGSCAY
jgi:23S rRNA A2030 N6-methylase RlmJ